MNYLLIPSIALFAVFIGFFIYKAVALFIIPGAKELFTNKTVNNG